jgi:radical SAM-linked protein
VRLRVRFAKLGKVRFTSHRDIARVWERAIRRAQLPVAYSQGFTPRPRVSFGLALSTGYESLAEYLDIELDTVTDGGTPPIDVAALPDTLSDALPAGIDVTAVAVVEPGADSLQQAVTSCSWDIVLRDVTPEVVDAAIARVLAADHLPVTRERKGKPVSDDLRPGVLALARVDAGAPGVLLRAELGAQPRALRPSELLAVMDLGDHEGLVRRTHQWMNDGQGRREPIAADVARRVPDPGDTERKDHHDVRATGRPDADPGGGRHSDPRAGGPTGSHPGGSHDAIGDPAERGSLAGDGSLAATR